MMMDQQSSKTLRSMFEHYSVWGGENAPRKMKQKNFEDFLAKHQHEGDRYNSEEVAGILSRHKIQVEVLKERTKYWCKKLIFLREIVAVIKIFLGISKSSAGFSSPRKIA